MTLFARVRTPLLAAAVLLSGFGLWSGVVAQEGETTAPDTAEASDAIEADLWLYRETRMNLGEKNEDGWAHNDVSLIVHVDLPEADRNPSFWGKTKLSKAVTDTKEDLTGPEDLWPDPTGIHPFEHHYDAVVTEGGVAFPVPIKMPSRGSKSVTVEGEFALVYAGEITSKDVIPTKEMEGKALVENKELGYSVTLVKASGQVLSWRVSGKLELVLGIDLLDADGEEFWDHMGQSTEFEEDGSELVEFDLNEDPKGLVIRIRTTDKLEERTFTFKLSEQKLP